MRKMPVFLLLLAIMLAAVGCGKQEIAFNTVADITQAEGAKIGAMTGSTGEALARKTFTRGEVKSFDDVMDAVAAITSGQIDAIVTAYPTALQVSKKNSDLIMLDEPLAHEDTAIAIRKDNQELLQQINAVIAELKNDGTLKDMGKRWFKHDLSPYVELDISVPTSGTPLKVGVTATREPLTFVDKTGRVTGHDGELARIIASKLKRPVEFYNMKFMALIPALQSGKVDMILSGMSATAERKQYVNFTEPYFANAQVILVKKAQASKAALKKADSDNDITSLQDLHDKRIAVLTGSAGDLAARKYFPQAKIKDMVQSSDAALAIKENKVDAFVYDKSVLLNLAEKNPDLHILSEPVSKLEIAVAITKQQKPLLNEINAVLARLKSDGTLQQLRSKWIDSRYQTVPKLSVSKKSHHKQKLRIGTCAQIEPFSFQAHGALTGLDIELGHLLAEALRREAEFVDMSFEALIPALQSGKIDIAMSNFNVTEERKRLIDFSQAYVENDISALVRKPVASALATQPAAHAANDAGTVSNVDISKKRIAVLLGSAHDKYVTEHYPQASVLQYKTTSDLVLAVKSGKADVSVFDEDPLREVLKQNNDLAILGKPLFSFPVAVGFNKNNPQLRAQFDQFLAQIKKDGTYDDMVKRWIRNGDTAMPQIKAANTNGTLHVAVSDVGLPFVAVKDNRLVGFDIELVQRFAAHQGKQIEITNYELGSLVAAVASGKADMLASSIFVTEERKQHIDFSAPYYEMGAVLFALKNNASGDQTPARDKPVPSAGVKLHSVADLKDKRIGVLLGSVHDTYALQHYPNATVMQYKSPSDLVLAVKSGKVDAAIYMRETLIEILASDPELALLGDSLQEYPIGIGFNQENDALREQFNAFLKTIRQDGTYDDMVKRWLKQGDTTMPVISNSKRNGVLVAGNVSDKGLPFTAVKDGRLIGFDIELADRFGAYLGKEVRYADMEFGSLIVAAATNKIDMIVSTLMLTDERKTKIDFSDPYYELGANVFALKKNIVTAAVQDAAPSAENGMTGQSEQKQPAATAAPEKHMPGFIDRMVSSFNSNIIQEDRYLLILDGLKVTVIISVFATLFGTLLGGVICFMRMSHLAILNIPARLYISIIRGTPVLVFLMLIFYVVFASVNINPVFVAVIAFGMNFAAYVSEIFRTGINGVDKGQIEAGIAMGFTKLNTFIYITLPQTIQRILPVYKGEFISLVKMTSIVGYIAVQDLTKASDIIRSRTFDAFFPLVMIAILYFLISWVLMQSIEYLERRTDPKQRRKKRMKA